jgi:hypothetical protein
MLDEISIQLALRSRLLAMTVTTTGSISLAATTTGYVRTTGSFITDGFSAGMEITPAGFTNNSKAVITDVSALTITAKRIMATTANGVTTYALAALTAEAAAGSRSLTVGLPSQRAWENYDDDFQPTAGIPWVREEMSLGPHGQITIGPGGDVRGEPQYAIHFYVPTGTKLTAKRYTHAARVTFAPNQDITITGGRVRVRGQPAPLVGPLLPNVIPGFAGQTIQIPIEVRSPNVI